MSQRRESDGKWLGGAIEIPKSKPFDYPWLNMVMSDAAQDMLDTQAYYLRTISSALGVPAELVRESTKNNKMKNFPIGAEVYVRDNSYAKNLATGKNDSLADSDAVLYGRERKKCRVLTTPFKAQVKEPFSKAYEHEFVMVQPEGTVEVHQVLNSLEDADKIFVQLNDTYTAELSSEHPGFIKVGCQLISFEKVREMADVVFNGRKPEPMVKKSKN